MDKRFYIGNLKQATSVDEFLTEDVKPSEKVIPFFREVCKAFEEMMEQQFENKSGTEEADLMLQQEHNAIKGVPKDVTFFLEKIQAYIDSNEKFNLKSIDIPEYYIGLQSVSSDDQSKFSDLAHAIFHEVYGFGPLAHWKLYPFSYAAQIIGRQIYMFINGKKRRMSFEFSSDEQVERIIRLLVFQNKELKVNRYSPEGEVDLYTGERVTFMIPPRVKKTVITFRRFLIERIKIEDLSQKGTIPMEAVPILKGISRCHCNTIIAGAVGTGKSTDIKALIGERSENYTGAIIEKHYELAVSRDYPELPIIEIIADEDKFHHSMDRVLRSDVDYAVVGEVRRVEVEGAVKAMERLHKGFLGTYHTWKPLELPSQWAHLILDLFPNRNYLSEMGRVASCLDIIIIKTQTEDRAHKRIKGLYEIRYNSYSQEISLHPIMLWDKETDTWSYKMNLSKQLIKEMEEINAEWAKIIVQSLQRLEIKFPLQGSDEIFNPIAEQPLHKMVHQLEKLTDQLGSKVV